jgi:hypothetical protein
MTGTMRVLSRSGDTATAWDTTDEASVEEVRRQFDELVRGQRNWAYAYPAPVGDKVAKPEIIREFDPTAREIVVAPQLVGG